MEPNDMPLDRTALMRKMSWVVRRNMHKNDGILEQMGLSRGQIPVLMELGHHGELNQRELAGEMHVTPATLSATLKRMERSNLVERFTPEEDARVSLVRLTDSGMDMLRAAKELLDRTSADMLSFLTDEECIFLNRVLNKLADNIESAK